MHTIQYPSDTARQQTNQSNEATATQQASSKQQAKHHPTHHVDGLYLIDQYQLHQNDADRCSGRCQQDVRKHIFCCWHLDLDTKDISVSSCVEPITITSHKKSSNAIATLIIFILSLLSVSSFCKWCSIDMFGLMPWFSSGYFVDRALVVAAW